MIIGNNNVFEVGSIVRAKSIGDHNIFETKCKEFLFYQLNEYEL